MKIIKEKKVIKIKTDKDGHEITIKIDEDGEHNMVFIDEDGNKTKITDEDIEKMIQSHQDGEGDEIHKKIEVIVMKGDDDDAKEIEVEVKKEIGEDGEEKIIEKKVWITKDGKKIELDGESDYEFKTDGDIIKIKVDTDIMEIDDFSDAKTEGENVMLSRGIEDDNKGINQTMNIIVKEEDGEQFIEIDIKRTNSLNVTISEILKDDTSLDGIDYSLKNNLKPSQLNYYPNPNNGKFNLKFMLDKKEEVTVKVMDILGKEVYKETLLDFNGTYENKIDLTGKEKGIYILQIIQKRKALTRKILIE